MILSKFVLELENCMWDDNCSFTLYLLETLDEYFDKQCYTQN